MENTHTSIIGVLYSKFVEYVSEKPLGSLVKFTGLSFACGVLSSFLTEPDFTLNVLRAAMHWHHGVLTAIAWSIFLVFFSPRMVRAVYAQIIGIIEFLSDQSCESDETIEGIPVTEMVDHLFESKSFKREEVESIFGIPRNRYQRLAEKMEELDILKRGENNSRVLNPKMNRAEVIEILKGKRVAMDLERPLNIVRSPLPRTPIFISKNIEQTA